MLAEQIASLRKQAGMSQQQLANKLMVVPSTIGMYEQGRRTPSIDILIQMAEVFQVSLDFLITGGDTVDTQADKGALSNSDACSCQIYPPRHQGLQTK